MITRPDSLVALSITLVPGLLLALGGAGWAWCTIDVVRNRGMSRRLRATLAVLLFVLTPLGVVLVLRLR